MVPEFPKVFGTSHRRLDGRIGVPVDKKQERRTSFETDLLSNVALSRVLCSRSSPFLGYGPFYFLESLRARNGYR